MNANFGLFGISGGSGSWNLFEKDDSVASVEGHVSPALCPCAANGGGMLCNNGGTCLVCDGQTSCQPGGHCPTPGGVCATPTSCGGDSGGNWTVTSSCIQVSGAIAVGTIGLGPLDLGCASAPVTGACQLHGTLTGKSDGTSSDDTVATCVETLTFAPTCKPATTTTCSQLALAMYSTQNYRSVDCKESGGAGDWCSCSAIMETGGARLGHTSCVSGNQMAWTVEDADTNATGTVIFQKAGSS
jgi:hypothetical protein